MMLSPSITAFDAWDVEKDCSFFLANCVLSMTDCEAAVPFREMNDIHISVS